MSTEPDPWEEPPAASEPSRPPQQPGATLVAGIAWMTMGVLFFFFGCLNMVLVTALVARQPNRPATGTEGCTTWLSFGIGTALFLAGRNLWRGKAKDVVGSSVFAILLGLFYLALSVTAFLFLARDGVLGVLAGATGFLVGMGSILPAVLALTARSQYLEWLDSRREYRRRRRREEEEPKGDAGDSEGKGGSGGRPWDRGRGGAT